LSSRYGHDVWGAGKERRFFGAKHWQEPLKWNLNAAARGAIDLVFCGSMCDVMDAEVDDRHRQQLWALIEATPNLHWQLLTKRPNLIRLKVPPHWIEAPPRNVWWGTSVEDERVLSRITHLAAVPAAVRFLSVEPMIGRVPLGSLCLDVPWGGGAARGGRDYSPALDFLDWIIFGGESGPGARPMDRVWLEDGIESCQWRPHVAAFVKQLGVGLAKALGIKGKGDDPSEWPEDLRVQEFPRHYHEAVAQASRQ
jgi:protein gp37